MNPKRITTILMAAVAVALLPFARPTALAARRDGPPVTAGTLLVMNKGLNVQGDDDRVLADGIPPLTLRMAESLTYYYAYMLNLKLTPERRR